MIMLKRIYPYTIHPFFSFIFMDNPKPKSKAQKRAQTRKNLQTKRAELMDTMKLQPAMNQKEVLIAYKDDLNKNHNQVLQALSSLKSRISALPQGYVNQFALKKAHVQSVKALRDQLSAAGVDTSTISTNDLLDLVALDDWSTIASVAWPLIKQYGVPMLRHLYSTYVKPKVDKFMGGDSGVNPADWGFNGQFGSTLGPQKFTPVLGETVEMPGVKPVSSHASSFNTVDPKSIASVLCPELYKHRYAFSQTQKVALAVTSLEISVSTNAAGAFGLVVYPLNIIGAGNNQLASYFAIFNDATFSVSSGSQTPSSAFAPGPLYSAISSIQNARATSTSVVVNPIASFATAGALTLAFDNRNGLSNLTNFTIGSTLSDLKLFPFVTSFNTKTTARMITVSSDATDEDFRASGSYVAQKFVLMGSGLPASTEVVRVLVTAVSEFKPAMAALPICPLDYPRSGPLTEQFESMMFMRFPMLQSMDLAEAKQLTDSLPEGPTPFDTLLELFFRLVAQVKPKAQIMHLSPSSELSLPNQSIDLVLE